MIVTLSTPIGDIAAKQPRACELFDRHGIGYCCEGDRPLRAACAAAQVDPVLVLRQIRGLVDAAAHERDWTQASLLEVTGHIVSSHHAFLRGAATATASALEEAVRAVPATTGVSRDELLAWVRWLREGLAPHLRVEEERIFPAIVRIERIRLTSRPTAPRPAVLLEVELPELAREHRGMDLAVRELRRAADRCFVARPPAAGFLRGLAALEHDLHRHLHLENNVLFPRALALEAAYA